ncbi:hypothetical protein KIL84_011435 [Mauremys mutica]|uniref:Uncharacterized protein n=1 Tax=Mauremys mutica TaxID=74926 RepID=A0A9D4B120_9SAUR|nr:hypothetical protein KIL84_011435 [Mauremys mutica]
MSDESSEVPRELLESIKDVIGRKIKISVKKKVKLETKGDKVDNKILVEDIIVKSKCSLYVTLSLFLKLSRRKK